MAAYLTFSSQLAISWGKLCAIFNEPFQNRDAAVVIFVTTPQTNLIVGQMICDRLGKVQF
jgi:hypothetical protein